MLLTICQKANSQDSIENLETSINERKIDTTLILDQYELGNFYLRTDSIKSKYFYHNALENSYFLKYRFGEAKAYFGIGKWKTIWTKDFISAEGLYLKALTIYQQENRFAEELEMTKTLSLFYQFTGDSPKSVDFLHRSLKRYPENNLYKGSIYNELGNIFKSSSKGTDGITYYDKSEKFINQILKPERNEELIILSNDKNRGVIYRNLGSYDTAYFYLNRSLLFSQELGDSMWMARNYNSLAILYQYQNDEELAIETYKKSLHLKRQLNYMDGVLTTLTNLGQLYVQNKEFNLAFKCLSEAEELSERSGYLTRKVQIKESMALYYSSKNNFKLAFQYLTDFHTLKDSLLKQENFKESKKLEALYQNKNNKILQEKLKADLAASDLREVNKSAKIKSQQNYILLGVTVSIMLFGLIIYVISTNIRRKKANHLLRVKNDEVLEKNKKIEIQKHEIEEKNQEILDSINYAKRIQNAILPNPKFFKEKLKNSFIYYQPKDVLAGDFYWMDVADDYIIWAAADCTGHGIPGAMVSVVCHNALNRSVYELGMREPGKILESTRELVIETFIKSGQEVKDGMDIAICCYRPDQNELLFAGANNPLWIIRKSESEILQENELQSKNGDLTLIEVKGDKQPVGLHFLKEAFTTHKVQLKKNDLLYLFTDGFADQFGGQKGKKLKNKNFKKLLLEKAKTNINDQGKVLSSEFNSWKAEFEQLDDVCVIGVQL